MCEGRWRNALVNKPHKNSCLAKAGTHKMEQHLIWIDLEMTGLVVEDCTILEIATLVTNKDLEIVAEGPVFAIHHSDEELAKMDAWCTEHHGASGLTERVRHSTISLAEAERRTLAFLQQYTLPRKSPLCGNTIFQDRLFLLRYMPTLEAHFHYRSVDVSSIKELVTRWYPPSQHAPRKKNAHLALDDIRESIEELRFYRQHLFVAPQS